MLNFHQKRLIWLVTGSLIVSSDFSRAEAQHGLADLRLPPGFKVEHLARAQSGQGSWACVTFDHRGRLLLSAQNGPLLRASLPGPHSAATQIEPISTPFSGAQGLLDVDGVLWANVAQMPNNNGGLWRLVDSDADDYYDEATRVVRWGNNSEHGPHGLVQGPGGYIWAVNGNYTGAPAHVLERSAYRNYAHDMLDQIADPGGHAVGVKEPAAVVYRVSPDGSEVERVAGGMRNPYDLAFNTNGDLFTYDADMEWDLGTPWYRAPRILHVVSGGEYGWRSGSAKWPEGAFDAVSPVVETDVSSPTGMVFGDQTGFPEPWRSALFVGDWAYGRVLAVMIEPQGAGYTGTWRTFMEGRPFNITDMTVGPDGALYLITGGRGTRSDLYRVSYTEDFIASDIASRAEQTHPLTTHRRQLEQLHGQADLSQIDFIWSSLGHPDTSISYAARVALERLEPSSWVQRLESDQSIDRRLMALLSLVRTGDQQLYGSLVVDQLKELSDEPLNSQQRLKLTRLLQVLVGRWPQHSEQDRNLVLSMIEGFYTSSDARVALMALEIAVTLQDERAVAQLIRLLEESISQEDQIHAATILRRAQQGWTSDQRASYFRWLAAAKSLDGGRSFGGFIDVVERDARGGLTESQLAEIDAAIANAPPEGEPKLPPPPLVRAWTYGELSEHLSLIKAPDRNPSRGQQLFERTQCLTCHRINGQGGRQGPDLTGVGSRFSEEDLLRAIVEPSAIVADQYRQVTLWLQDGTGVTGRVVGGDSSIVEIDVDPYGHQRERVSRAEIVETEIVPTSSMPIGLINQLTLEEILDLMAFLIDGGSYDEPGTPHD